MLNSLTIDLSECPQGEAARGINWRELDTIYRPKKVYLIKVEVYFAPPSPEPWNSTIERIDFKNCLIPNITTDTFYGLTNLREIHFFQNFILTIFPNAIHDLSSLQTLEFADSSIGEIETEAISQLPNIRDIGFIGCHIEILRRNSILNMKYPQLPTANDCPNIDIRTNRADLETMHDMTGRLLEYSDNLPLPKFGARLTFLRCTITTFSSNSIKSDMFAFAIFGGNIITHLNERALNLQLSNQCHITAVMFSSNLFRNIYEGALASATSLSSATHATYLVLTNNTFEYVARNGFLIHPTLKIFTVEQNFFDCQCPYFHWAIGENLTSSQSELEKLVLKFGKCNSTNQNIGDFASSCSDFNGFPTTPKAFRPWTGDHSTVKPLMTFTETITSAGTMIEFSICNLFAPVLFLVILMMS